MIPKNNRINHMLWIFIEAGFSDALDAAADEESDLEAPVAEFVDLECVKVSAAIL